MTKFINSDIILWIINFDQDDFSYIHYRIESALDAIKLFIENGLVDVEDNTTKQDAIDKILDACANNICKSNETPYVTLTIGDDKLIHIRRIVLDKHNIINRILTDVYSIVDDFNRKRIESVFQQSS